MASVVHRADQHRFVIEEDGAEGELVYELRDGEVAFVHTGVPPQIQNRGLAADLVAAGTAWAASEQLVVVPQCSYVQVWLKRHPEQAAALTIRWP